jgi:uncharacterized membrane protein YeaQ/YmgE (transglycosylase-associated protein family)
MTESTRHRVAPDARELRCSSDSWPFGLLVKLLLGVIGAALVVQVIAAFVVALAPMLAFAALLAISVLVALVLLAAHMLL